jgi:anti-sigma regulatory factor (Ser/Thr protein kinase)
MSEHFSFSMHLPAHPVSVSMARSAVRCLISLVDAKDLEHTELVLSEVLTNAIRHGSCGIQDSVAVEIAAGAGRITGIVRDTGPVFEPPAAPPAAAEIGGYGLHIAMSLSDLTISHTAAGNTVTFTVPGPAKPAAGG